MFIIELDGPFVSIASCVQWAFNGFQSPTRDEEPPVTCGHRPKRRWKYWPGVAFVWKRGTETSTGLPGLLDHDYGNNKLSSCSLTIVLQFWSLPVSGESDTFQTASSCERLQLPWAFGNAGSCRETSCASITSMDRWSSPKWVGGLKRFCSFNHTVDGRNPINHQ